MSRRARRKRRRQRWESRRRGRKGVFTETSVVRSFLDFLRAEGVSALPKPCKRRWTLQGPYTYSEQEIILDE